MTAGMGGLGDTEKVAFGAYAQPLAHAAKIRSSTLKVALVAADCTLLGLQPVLVHLSKNKAGTFSFDPLSVNLMTELCKVCFALTVLLCLGTGRPGPPFYRSLRSFVADARHNALLAVPAGLYAVNNNLKFAMQLYFRPTTTKMLSNLKIFTVAVLMRTVMHRRFNVIQYEALFLLVAGITVNQLHSCSAADGGERLPPGSLLPAALCVLGSVTVPSAASVYNEKGLKKNMETSVHLQNFFLYLFGACFNLAAALAACALRRQSPAALLFGNQTRVTLLLVVTNAMQGILSSFFYKFADTILKKYSSTIATIFTALLSWLLFGHRLTVNFLVGVSIVFVSMHQFFTFGDKGGGAAGGGAGGKAGAARGSMVCSPSMDHIRLESPNGLGALPEDRPLLPR